MSESSFPFEGQSVAVAPETVPAPEGGGDRTKLLALGGLAVVLVLAVLAYFLLFAGDGSSDDAVVPPKTSTGAEVPAADSPAAAAPKVKKERLSAKSFGKDPFKALIVPAEEAAPSSTVDTTVTASSTGTTVAPVTTTTSGGTTSTTPETSVPATSTSHTFKVVDVAPDNSAITVRVDGKLYRNLKAGEVFAKFFKVRLISGQVNSFQFGEEKFNVIGFKVLTIA